MKLKCDRCNQEFGDTIAICHNIPMDEWICVSCNQIFKKELAIFYKTFMEKKLETLE